MSRESNISEWEDQVAKAAPNRQDTFRDRQLTLKPIMTYLGKVSNGVVLLPPDALLPDGTEVRIEPLQKTEDGKTFYERYSEFVGVLHDLPEDFAENHDHYIHGTPKRSRE